MHAAPCRRFTVLDAMILVAATAVGLGWMRLRMGIVDNGIPTVVEYLFYRDPAIPNREYHDAIFFEDLLDLRDLLLVWTLAAIFIRLRRPRPRVRRLARQPGFAALVVVVSPWGLSGAANLVGLIVRTPPEEFFDTLAFSLSGDRGLVDLNGGLAVMSVWTIMALGRMSRREPGWIDGLGWTLGGIWTALFLVAHIYFDFG